MMDLDEREIERHLRSGMDQAAPNEGRLLWDKICAQVDKTDTVTTAENGAGTEESYPDSRKYWYLKGTETLAGDTKSTEKSSGGDGGDRSRFRRAYIYRTFAAAAAVFLIVFAFSMQKRVKQESAPWASVCLDVNPGITLDLDEMERITRVEAENADGKLILDGMDLKQVQVDVAVNALVGSMVRHGYLTQAKQFILLTVDGQDKESAHQLQEELSRRIDRSLEKLTGRSAVFGQLGSPDEEVISVADKFGITKGKAFLLKKLVLINPQLTYEELAGLTMEELYNRLWNEGIDLSDYADYTGDELEEEEEVNYYEDEEGSL